MPEIADTLTISIEFFGHMIREYFRRKKLSAKWVPRKLTFDQKPNQLIITDEIKKKIC